VKYLSLVALAAAGLGIPASAPAQDSALIVYGSDPCPANTICVRAPESDRYRIPKSLRSSNLPPSQAPGKLAATSRTGGVNTGPSSCSNIGGGGGSTCLKNQLAAARAERAQKKSDAAESSVPK
jgi:hypothetical protein